LIVFLSTSAPPQLKPNAHVKAPFPTETCHLDSVSAPDERNARGTVGVALSPDGRNHDWRERVGRFNLHCMTDQAFEQLSELHLCSSLQPQCFFDPVTCHLSSPCSAFRRPVYALPSHRVRGAILPFPLSLGYGVIHSISRTRVCRYWR